ncbi:MAG: patatin [Gammaproteobacteria bacterium]|jgi:NTE family protein|nr:patatin [Gammaproteobacteria bacterium]
MNIKGDDLGLVMSGGGARAAYQVGFLRGLAHHHKEIRFPIITGVSAGAINAAYLANESGSFESRIENLANIWAGLTIDHVFRVDAPSILMHVGGWAVRLIMGRASKQVKVRAMVDTEPLREFLERIFRAEHGCLKGIESNIASGELKGIAITASSYSTGQSITWVHGEDVKHWERAHRESVMSDIQVEHIMASASLPLFFPAVQVKGEWYGDGGIRLTAPLSPAIHIGARRILAISTRYLPTPEEQAVDMIDDYPPPAQVVGSMFNAIFLDVFDNDALRLERINSLIEAHAEPQDHDLEPVKLLLLRPSRNLGEMANQFEPNLPPAFRFMTRGLGTKETRSNDLLSMVMFQQDYISELMALGYRDAETRMDEINAFFEEESE